MANTYSSLKRARQTKQKTQVNAMRKSRMRHQVRTMRRLLEEKDASAATAALSQTFSAIDRAAKFGIIKDNTAARYKSNLVSRVKALVSA
jgi:small subunit ribosomal protein S20